MDGENTERKSNFFKVLFHCFLLRLVFVICKIMKKVRSFHFCRCTLYRKPKTQNYGGGKILLGEKENWDNCWKGKTWEVMSIIFQSVEKENEEAIQQNKEKKINKMWRKGDVSFSWLAARLSRNGTVELGRFQKEQTRRKKNSISKQLSKDKCGLKKWKKNNKVVALRDHQLAINTDPLISRANWTFKRGKKPAVFSYSFFRWR